jgi:ethanolamine utilization protein EutN
MLKATVIGSVWATRRLDEIPPGAFLEVQTDDGARLIAFDVLGSGNGEHVLVATGSVASGWFGADHPPIDALIIGSLDASTEDARGAEPATVKQRRTKER